jgi:hypothetical protein
MERVVPVAQAEGATFFKVFRQVREAGKDALMAENRRWMKRRIAEGRTIIDIGEDAAKQTRGEFYNMEKELLREAMQKR